MQTFLTDVIDDILKKEKSISSYTFILPSKRAGVFLKEEIKKKVKNAIIFPKIISTEEFVSNLSSLNSIDNTKLLFEFYTVYLENSPKDEIEDFDTFSKWATIALQDFNEIDRHLIDADYIFSYLKDINRIENWDLKKNKETSFTKKYFSFFDKLHQYYKSLYERLKQKNNAYQGMIYREAVDNINIFIENTNENLVFVGFNALNASEEKIIQQLLESDIAQIYWDADEYYFDNNQTSIFFKKYLSNWNHFKNHTFNWIKDNLKQSKNIQVIGCPKNNTQLKYVGEILSKKNNYESTALVLADETLLPLTLNSLPNNVNNINITMGYDLKNIAIAKLFNQVLKLHVNSKKGSFYYQDVLRILNHPSIKSNFNVESLIEQILKNNYTFLNFNTLKKLIKNSKEVVSVLGIFKELNKDDVLSALKESLNLIEDLKTKTTNHLEKEFLFKIYNVFQQIITLNKEFQYIKNIKTLHQFYVLLLSNEKLSFKGEPLSGLQLMGVLETRVLDFETIILTSVNEGILPAGKSDNSFIPFDVKKQVGLPTYQEKDAIFSYHFYRLLQRAKNVYLLYNTENDQFGTGEKSRFITQLEIRKPNCITKQIISPKTNPIKIELKEIKKNTDITNKLHSYAKRGISPSALTSYMYNPVDFYKQKVLKIKEVEEVEETIATNTLGTIIHKTLEALYTPFKENILKKENIVTMKKMVALEVKKWFKKEYLNGDISTGKNLIIYNIAQQYVNNFLDQELKLINNGNQIKILALEYKVETEVTINELDFTIKLKGEIDRIDQFNGTTRIIDYKTGKVEASKVSVVEWDDLTKDYDKYSKSFQILMYTFLMYRSKEINLPVEAGIISFKNLNSGFLKFTKKDKEGRNANKETLITQETLSSFEKQLYGLILEIFNSEIPFVEKN